VTKYTNPKIPEGISSGHEHPLAEAARSSVIVIGLIAAVIVGSYLIARTIAPYVPFAWEQALGDQMVQTETGETVVTSPTQQALAALAERVADASDLPADMTITVHYVESDTVNAFATLGGQIVVFEGLWNLLESENAAAMLLAHEIAHVKNRDPIRSAGGIMLASLASGVLLGDFDTIQNLVGAGNLLTAMHFSRGQETQADLDAATAVVRLYGHLNGGTDLFDSIRHISKEAIQPPEFLASHPHLDERIAHLRYQADQNGWSLDGDKTPLP
jgi:predicted Zn-dependent protease